MCLIIWGEKNHSQDFFTRLTSVSANIGREIIADEFSEFCTIGQNIFLIKRFIRSFTPVKCYPSSTEVKNAFIFFDYEPVSG